MTQQDCTDVSSSMDPEISGPPVTGELLEVPLCRPEITRAPEGHVVLVLPAGEVITGSMAATADEEIERLAASGKVPVLLVLTGVEAITRSARTVFSNARSLEAVAVLGVSPADRVIANFLLGGNAQPCPTRYFSTEAEALDWLQRKCPIA
jgi:hypothetical protein